jgi:hypothetical protein
VAVNPIALVAGDFNGDTKLDLAVVNACADVACANGSVSILLGNGDATFQTPADYAVGVNPFAIAAGDFDGDTKPDLVVANALDNSASVLMNKGDNTGTFLAATTEASELVPLAVVTGDFNHDGKADFVLANSNSNSVTLHLGNGNGTFQSLTSFPVGTTPVALAVADLNGDTQPDLLVANLAGNDVSVLLNATPASVSTSTAVSSDVNPSTFGQLVTFTATVTSASAGTPTGTVTFSDGATTIGTGTLDGAAQATFSTSALTVGGHSITATYGGDSTFPTSTSAPLTQTVDLATTAAAVSSSANPSNFGQSVTFTASVTSTGGTPTGNVAFKDGAAVLGTTALDGAGQATLATSALTVGAHNITVSYAGDASFAASTSATLIQDVNKAPTTSAVVSSLNPSSFGQLVTFTANVTSSSGTPSGNVTFLDGASPLGTVALDGAGQAQLATSALAAGTHSITVSYAGDATHAVSSSSAVNQVVDPAATSTALASNLNPSSHGQSVTLTATVTSGGGTPGGSVTFNDGVTSLGTVPLNGSGQAALSLSTLGAGVHSITASYSGNVNFDSSASSPLSQTVNQATSLLSLISSLNPSGFSQTVSFTATVVPAFGGAATGTVNFFDGATPLGSAPVAANAAVLSTSALAVGSHSITAVFGGDANVSGSTSSPLTQVVAQGATTTTLVSSANPVNFHQPVTFTAMVNTPGGTATGNVTFKRGTIVLGTVPLAGNQAALTTSSLPLGTLNITAKYAGDSNLTGSTSAVLSQVVRKVPTGTVVTSSMNPAGVGQPVTFTATVNSSLGAPPDGEIVTFKDGMLILGTVPLSGGTASITTTWLASAQHTIKATYAGDATFSTSTSSNLVQNIVRSSTSTALTGDVDPSTFGESVTFSATVSSGAGTPTGTVTFKLGTTVLGTAPLVGGTATFSTSALASGSRSLTAMYGGSSAFKPSSSPVWFQQVNRAPTNTTVITSPNPSLLGQTVTLTANVVSGTGAAPVGTVTFKMGTINILGVVNVINGVATLQTNIIDLGSNTITATYSGGSNFLGSSGTTLQVVH